MSVPPQKRGSRIETASPAAPGFPLSREHGFANAIALMPLEILDFALVLLRGGLGVERAEVPALAGLRILLARIDAVTRFELADHGLSPRAFNARGGPLILGLILWVPRSAGSSDG